MSDQRLYPTRTLASDVGVLDARGLTRVFVDARGLTRVSVPATSGDTGTPKHIGMCPFCKEEMIPKVIMRKTMRRDLCTCANCGGSILVCRVPGCHDYTKGGPIYDDELCPLHTKATMSTVFTVIATVGTYVATALASQATTRGSDQKD